MNSNTRKLIDEVTGPSDSDPTGPISQVPSMYRDSPTDVDRSEPTNSIIVTVYGTSTSKMFEVALTQLPVTLSHEGVSVKIVGLG